MSPIFVKLTAYEVPESSIWVNLSHVVEVVAASDHAVVSMLAGRWRVKESADSIMARVADALVAE
jgi:hypothetical protein